MYEEVCYEKSFLKQVISRIDFISPLPGLEKTLPPKLTKVLSDHFPIIEPTETLTHQIEFNLVGAGGVQQRQTPLRIWNFYGKDREKQLSLGSQYVFVSYTQYSTYEHLKKEFSSVVAALDDAFRETRAGRFGLRYINNIEIEGASPIEGWEEYITPVLITPPQFFAGQQLTRLLHVAELKCGDLALRFQFGLPNPDYPSPIKRPSFILDLDAYLQAAHDLGESLQYMEQAHDCIQRLFEKSITDKLRERMHAQAAPSVQ
jgi:uncharacterized protein (TIGR04255 family)